MSSIDLCIVSGRRPELLAQTLDSFRGKVFDRLGISHVYVNLDAIFGSEDDHARCIEVILQFDPTATIFEPEKSGFAAAVQRLWSATTSDYVLHLEDDWVALRDLGTEVLAPFADPDIMQVSFHTADQNWDIARRGHFHQRNEYAKVLGIKIPLFRTFPKFTTSPSISRGVFLRRSAEMMDISRDPEKQFYSGVNRPLEAYVGSYRNYIYSPDGVPVIRDTGREWRDQRHIAKTITNATSTWTVTKA